MKQNEYDQWNDPQELYSDEYFLLQKGVATPHEYLVECYHDSVALNDVRKFNVDANLLREIQCKKIYILMFKRRFQCGLNGNK